MKIKEIISEIKNDLRSLNIDDRVSSRYVFSKLKSNVALFVKRENDQLRLWNYSDIWTTVNCIEMEQSNLIDCCSIKIALCQTVSKTKFPLPDLYSYSGGPLIREVMSIDGSSLYRLTTPLSYKEILNREFNNPNQKFYWIENNHIIIPNSRVRLIRVTGFFSDPIAAIKLNSCDAENDNDCIEVLEQDFQCPAHLVQVVKEATIVNIFNFYKRNIVDENPNLDTNLKQGLT